MVGGWAGWAPGTFRAFIDYLKLTNGLLKYVEILVNEELRDVT